MAGLGAISSAKDAAAIPDDCFRLDQVQTIFSYCGNLLIPVSETYKKDLLGKLGA